MSRARALGERLSELGCDALLITGAANVRYLSGFTTPEDGRILVTGQGSWLVTDGRYTAQATEESLLPVEVTQEWIPWVGARVAGRLGVEAEHVTLAEAKRLEEAVGSPVLPLDRVLDSQRAVKERDEIAALRRAAEITDAAFEHILGRIEPGIREVEIALELERFMLLAGAEARSFDIIVASGPRSAMPHGVASQKRIDVGDLVTLDFGAVVGGYHADMTRTVGVGEVSPRARFLYDAVLEAQEAALAALRPGMEGREVDAVAREVLSRHGLEEHFPHGLGHGVGLQIHERPRLSRSATEVLQAGMTVTVEPGVYIPGEVGLRIEDLVVVTEDGCERLSLSAKDYRRV